eukprot:GFYU01002077.1.p1 GENE.GFYU01002077.1~~GFYU01002077.1.p1  ORF type:complete len:414 (+),score=51.80 GFYU01002077.1:305-1546(+)
MAVDKGPGPQAAKGKPKGKAGPRKPTTPPPGKNTDFGREGPTLEYVEPDMALMYDQKKRLAPERRIMAIWSQRCIKEDFYSNKMHRDPAEFNPPFAVHYVKALARNQRAKLMSRAHQVDNRDNLRPRWYDDKISGMENNSYFGHHHQPGDMQYTDRDLPFNAFKSTKPGKLTPELRPTTTRSMQSSISDDSGQYYVPKPPGYVTNPGMHVFERLVSSVPGTPASRSSQQGGPPSRGGRQGQHVSSPKRNSWMAKKPTPPAQPHVNTAERDGMVKAPTTTATAAVSPSMRARGSKHAPVGMSGLHVGGGSTGVAVTGVTQPTACNRVPVVPKLTLPSNTFEAFSSMSARGQATTSARVQPLSARARPSTTRQISTVDMDSPRWQPPRAGVMTPGRNKLMQRFLVHPTSDGITVV